jgi:hypothetical protein
MLFGKAFSGLTAIAGNDFATGSRVSRTCGGPRQWSACAILLRERIPQRHAASISFRRFVFLSFLSHGC